AVAAPRDLHVALAQPRQRVCRGCVCEVFGLEFLEGQTIDVLDDREHLLLRRRRAQPLEQLPEACGPGAIDEPRREPSAAVLAGAGDVAGFLVAGEFVDRVGPGGGRATLAVEAIRYALCK